MTTLTMQEEKRLEVIQKVYRKELKLVQAARINGSQRAAILSNQGPRDQARDLKRCAWKPRRALPDKNP
jgi:hypothetical protein